tara:strand:- start:542 stop:1000 length:459 start_codon:yes stop_codon:yes gene_type:complete
MFKKVLKRLVTGAEAKELEVFVSPMRGFDGSEMGAVVYSTYKFSDLLREQFGWDIFYPHLVLSTDNFAVMKVGKIIKQLQSEGNMGFAAGGLVWLHTLRAAQNPELRLAAREIWHNLRRGFSHARSFASDVGDPLFCIGKQFPDGFTPEIQD